MWLKREVQKLIEMNPWLVTTCEYTECQSTDGNQSTHRLLGTQLSDATRDPNKTPYGAGQADEPPLRFKVYGKSKLEMEAVAWLSIKRASNDI